MHELYMRSVIFDYHVFHHQIMFRSSNMPNILVSL